jgi:hypothetical protein
MKDIKKQIAETGKKAVITASAIIGLSKVLAVILRVSQKNPEVIKKFFKVSGGLAAIAGSAVSLVYYAKNKSEASQYNSNRKADGDQYTVERMADAMLVKARGKASPYRESPLPDDADYDGDAEFDEETNRIPWIEVFKSKFSMPSLPPFLNKIMSGVPEGYEEAMLLHILSMLGAICFSKVRALYSDNIIHAANLQVIVEGNWGTGKAKFEQLFKELFSRIIKRSLNKIECMDDNHNNEVSIIQTTGIGTSMSRFVDILAANQGCHMYLFNSEVRALAYDLRKGNGINFDFLRKAFENGDVCRNNRAKDSQNGIFPIFLNYTITGTPVDIMTSFKKELEGGTLSRIAWTCIPEAGRYPGVLRLPKGTELDELRDQIDEWTDQYCCHFVPGGEDVPVPELRIDLNYVCKVLDAWNDHQFEQSVKDKNPARKDVRMRMAAIAFHCAIVIHMLYGNPETADWRKRKEVEDLTLFIANYCMERFLHKFGEEQNKQRKINQEAELVESAPETTIDTAAQGTNQLITDIAQLKALHDIKDDKGQSKYGWDTLAKMSGMKPGTVRNRIREYEAKLAK